MRQADRAAATRRAILDAAREVFAAAGFSDANVVDVVSRAGASVGSLYHHFGGKADLYLALFEDYQQRQESRAAAAVATERAAHPDADPIALFVAGARAYLHGCWTERDLARLFLAGGGPPGFELAARRRFHEWARLNELLLEPLVDGEAEPSAEALVLVLTTVVSEAGHQIAVCDDEVRAARLADEVVNLIGRLARPPVEVRG